MTKIPQDQIDEIVLRVTQKVVEEMKQHEAASQVLPDVHIAISNLPKPGEKVLWSPWTVALPPNIRIDAVFPGQKETE